MKNLTIAIVDTGYHALAAKSLDLAVEVTGANNVLVLSDRDFYPGSNFVKVDPISDKVTYSRLVLKELGKHITTDYTMVIQYDGMPTDATKWQDEFLKYDYIGAPWQWFPEDRRVGNGGFSLRSRRVTDLCLEDKLVFEPGPNEWQEDVHIGVLYKDWFVQNGAQFAPIALAKQFSAENPGGKFDTYGFHGTLCLPFYLSDEHLSFYIEQLTPRMLTNDAHIRVAFGLFKAQRYELLEHFMDKAIELNPNFKQVLMAQFPGDAKLYPEFSIQDIEDLLVNYE